MKIAIAYDWIDKWGGVERLLLVLHNLFPKADFFTSYVDYSTASWAKDMPIQTSFIQHLPYFLRKSRLLSFFLYPFAFETFNFSTYDVVISVTSSFAKSIITQPHTKHLCILLTPTRYIWLYPENYIGKIGRFFLKGLINYLLFWDRTVSARPDTIFSISQEVAQRCRRYYKKASEVVYPPFDLDYWNKIKNKIHNAKTKSDFFLVVSRLEPYKRIDLVIDAFNNLQTRNLLIIGSGSQLNRLKSRVRGTNITFTQNISDDELGTLYSLAKGFIQPQIEDFGYASVEAQFFGCPVIAYKEGGVKETIIDGKTGIFFSKQTVSSLSQALERFDKISYNLRCELKTIGFTHVQKFAKKHFEDKLKSVVRSS